MTATTSTHGYQPRRGSDAWRASVELLSSMRFAIALLTVICIASVIGTVIKQHEPAPNYVNQFGPFWAELFLKLQLNAVYSAWWFLLILAFLVVSTSLCVLRNTPKFLADIRSYKENIRHQSLKAFHHKAEGDLAEAPEAAARRIGQQLAGGGWKVRLQARETPEGPGWMVAAKAGAANKIGYIAAHSAIVLICLGGLFDGDLFVRGMTWLGGKSVYSGGGLVSDVQPEHRLPASNPAFRGNLVVSEGTQSSTAILSQSDGVLLQELPFAVELKKFIVEYYSTGMPKLFASEIVIHDKATGETRDARVEVNHPASYKGVQIYQSSFDDGGSRIKLRAVPMNGAAKAFEVEGTIGGSSQITNGNDQLTLEYTALRVINVENLSEAGRGSGADVRKVDLGQALTQRLGAADKTVTQRELRNVGPSITYKLRDAAGQANEFHNYMLPVDMGDGGPVFLLGVRASQAEGFRYLRVPADVVEPEAQVLLVEFDEIALRAQPRHRKGGPPPHRDDEPQPLRPVAQQPFDHLVVLPRLREVIVVEEDEGRRPVRRQGVQQRRQRFGVGRRGPGDGAGRGAGEIGDETLRIAVVLVERQPCRRFAGRLQVTVELREQCRLAEAGGRMQQRQQVRTALLEPSDQCAARHRVGVEHGRPELAQQQGPAPCTVRIAAFSDRLPPYGEGCVFDTAAL